MAGIVTATAILLALTIIVPSRGGVTLASWADLEYAGAAMAAITLPTPTVTSCVAENVPTLGKMATVKWALPAAPVLAVPGDIQFSFSKNGSLSQLVPIATSSVATTGPTNGVYTTVFNADLLGMVGSKALVGIATTSGSWFSPAVVYDAEWKGQAPHVCQPKA